MAEQTEKDWKHERKIATLPGVDVTPQIVLARSLDKVKKMQGVVVLIHWADGTWDEDHSAMKLSSLVWLERMFGIAITDEIRHG